MGMYEKINTNNRLMFGFVNELKYNIDDQIIIIVHVQLKSLPPVVSCIQSFVLCINHEIYHIYLLFKIVA